MITALVLAAGLGTRMGQQKLLLPCGPCTLIEYIIAQVIGGGVDACLVITGRDHDRIKPLVETLGGRAVFNPGSIDGGMLSSVRYGLSNAPSNTTGFLVCLGDQPGISSVMVRDMLDKIRQDKPPILTPVHQGKRGHPLFFEAGFRPEIMEKYDDVGLKGLLATHPHLVTEWEYPDDGILMDLDTPLDYENLMKRHREGG